MRRRFIGLLFILACRRSEPAWVVIDGVIGSQARIAADPADVISVVREGGRVRVALSGRRRLVRLNLEGACPILVTADENAPGVRSQRTLRSFLDFGPSRPQLGFDTAFRIDARPGCSEATDVVVSWRQTTGVPLRGLRLENNGHRLHARTVSFSDATGLTDVGWGPVPLSPRTRGSAVLVASWRDGRGQAHETPVEISAAVRATGQPHVAVGARIYLGGEGFRVVQNPSDGLIATSDLLPRITPALVSWFEPTQAGAYLLRDARGRELVVNAGQLDRVPLDCGRSGCHSAIDSLWQRGTMATVLDRRLRRPHGPNYPQCALGCHSAGEPGLADGGFAHVAEALQVDLGDPNLAAHMPRDLRRMAGVGCVSCHGPAAIPAQADRWMALRPGVCAVCHDSPPRYGHVATFAQTAMAKADHDPQSRTDPSCVGCHTTWGFLEKLAPGPDAIRSAALRRPPEHAAPFGLGCVSCHDVHGAQAKSLLRSPPTPVSLAPSGPSTPFQICLPCHAPVASAKAPAATAAAIWLGRGGLDVVTGAPMLGAAPHAQNPRGCLTCHNASRAPVERGGAHGFVAGSTACKACHPAGRLPLDLNARARDLAALLGIRGQAGPRPHHAFPQSLNLNTPAGRAAWNVLMVIEDPAAGVHNPTYARALLDSALAFTARSRR